MANASKKSSIKVDKGYRILGKPIPSNISIYLALQRVYGIGPTRSRWICDKYDMNLLTKVSDIDSEIMKTINQFLDESENISLEDDLRSKLRSEIEHEKRIQTYRSKRKEARLSINGRTRSNSKTTKRKGGK